AGAARTADRAAVATAAVAVLPLVAIRARAARPAAVAHTQGLPLLRRPRHDRQPRAGRHRPAAAAAGRVVDVVAPAGGFAVERAPAGAEGAVGVAVVVAAAGRAHRVGG